jgi:hypothetical protein
MARFQTYLADLLNIPPQARHVRVDWNGLAKEIGVAANTLRAYYSARVGSDSFIESFDGATAARVMAYFGLTELSQLVKFIPNGEDQSG